MILHRLELRRFLGLPDHTFDFDPGLNVVVGPNEAGKSTLRNAIRTVLYENPATASSRLREQFRSWQIDDPPELSLHFELNGRRFMLTKNYATRKVVLSDAVTGQTWEQHKSVQERVVAALGLPTDDLFDATAHIAQAHLEGIHVSSIGKELGRVIGGGGEDIAASLRRLEGHIRSLERGSRGAAVKEPGQLVAFERKAAALRSEVEVLRRNAAEADRARAELSVLSVDLGHLAEEFAAKKRLLDSNREILQLEQRCSTLKENERLWERKIRQIQEYTAKQDRLDRDLETATASGLPSEERVAQGRSLQERLRARERDLGGLASEDAVPADRPTVSRQGGLLAAVGIVLAAAGAALLRTAPAAGWAAILLGAATLASAVYRVSKATQARQMSEMRREERAHRRTALEAEIAETRTAFEQLLAGLGCATLADAVARLDGYRDLVQERRRTAEFLESLREGSTDEAIVEQWNTIRRDIFGMEDRLRDPEIAAKRLTPLQVQTLEREVADLEQTLAQKQRREMKLSVDIDRLAPDAELLAVKEEQLQDVDEGFARVRRHLDVCRLALEVLWEARRKAEIPVREIVETRAGDYLRLATGGRYDRLRVGVDGEGFDLSVWSAEAGDWVVAQEPGISRGTIDLIYLAVRLALVEVLTHGRRPPLLFDDPFITFDDRRRDGALQLLRELSKTHQVILFTCSSHYDRFADRVITLPDRWFGREAEPAAVPQGVVTTQSPSSVAEPSSAEMRPAPAQTSATAPVGPLWEQTGE
jgi:uncharacterized protein YhaN